MDFIEFLQLAESRVTQKPLVAFVDQHPLHGTEAVRTFCHRKGITLVFNAPYSSEFNAIERLWLLSKRVFRQQFIHSQVKSLKWQQVHRLVLNSIEQVPKLSLRRHVERCLQRMRDFIIFKSSDSNELVWHSKSEEASDPAPRIPSRH